MEELAIKETSRSRSIKSLEDKRRNIDDDDAPSEDEEEIMKEIDE